LTSVRAAEFQSTPGGVVSRQPAVLLPHPLPDSRRGIPRRSRLPDCGEHRKPWITLIAGVSLAPLRATSELAQPYRPLDQPWIAKPLDSTAVDCVLSGE